jgi:starch synthase
VRATGGLADTVTPFDAASGTGNGFVFEAYAAAGLRAAIERGLDAHADPRAWRTLQKNGMAEDFSWARPVPLYEALYASLRDEAPRTTRP